MSCMPLYGCCSPGEFNIYLVTLFGRGSHTAARSFKQARAFMFVQCNFNMLPFQRQILIFLF